MAVAANRYEDWLSAQQVDRLSQDRGEPSSFTTRRREAFERFLELPLEPNPLYRKYGYLPGVDLTGLDLSVHGSPVAGVSAAPRTITVLHDVAGSRFDVPEELHRDGIRLDPIEQVARAGGEELAAFLGGDEPAADRLTAFAFATTNRGYSSDTSGPARRPGPNPGHHCSLRPPRGALGPPCDPGRVRSPGSSSAKKPSPRRTTRVISVSLPRRPASRWAPRPMSRTSTLHAPDRRAISVFQRSATVGPSARLAWVWAGFGGFRTKARNSSTLAGTGADLQDLQAFYGCGPQAYDSGVTMTHVGTDTHGESITRGVFTDEARGMSRGMVRIEKDARKTLSFLSEHAMLLSRGARSDTIPILEILCRDVKATHSSSVAPVDPEKVFYLESRGFPRTEAVRLIGEGFLSHVLERAPVRGLRDLLYPYLAARWEGRPIVWGGDSARALPPLEFAGPTGADEWRFDAKLR